LLFLLLLLLLRLRLRLWKPVEAEPLTGLP
jgi:hypothetical protein